MSLREYLSALSLTLIPFTCPPFSTVLANTLKPRFFTDSEDQLTSSPKRVSGLSEP